MCGDGIKWKNARPVGKTPYNPTELEHLANIISHGVWIIPSCLSTWNLLVKSTTAAHCITSLVYGSSMITLFCASTLFHYAHYIDNLAKDSVYRTLRFVMHRVDRAAIYVFIAASYFPWFMLVDPSLRDKNPPSPLVDLDAIDAFATSKSWLFMEITEFFMEITEMLYVNMHWGVWIMALVGILYQQFFYEKYESLDLMFYIIMGCLPQIIVMLTNANMDGIYEINVSLMTYAIGIMFFRCDGIIPMAHAIWHVFVIYAAMIHYDALDRYLFTNVNGATPLLHSISETVSQV